MSTQINFGGSTVKTGSPFPQGQRITYRYDPSRGFTTIVDVKGFSQTQLQQLYNQYVANGISCELSFWEDIGSIHIDDSTQEFTIDSWQILGNEESRDGFSKPEFISALGKSGDATPADDALSQLRKFLADEASVTDVNNYLTDHDWDTAAALLISRFYSLQQRGSPDYRQGDYVLRHTTNVSNRWQVNIADFGVDQIYTPAQLLSEVSDSGLWIFPLPDRLQFKVSSIPVQGPQNNYLWGWLKSASTETNTANNRVDITTEYTCELWSVAPNGYYKSYTLAHP